MLTQQAQSLQQSSSNDTISTQQGGGDEAVSRTRRQCSDVLMHNHCALDLQLARNILCIPAGITATTMNTSPQELVKCPACVCACLPAGQNCMAAAVSALLKERMWRKQASCAPNAKAHLSLAMFVFTSGYCFLESNVLELVETEMEGA